MLLLPELNHCGEKDWFTILARNGRVHTVKNARFGKPRFTGQRNPNPLLPLNL